MSNFIYTDSLLTELEEVLSKERLSTYKHDSGRDEEKAMQLYYWNSRLSESFQLPLHILEVVLRNAFHRELSRVFGTCWYMNAEKELIARDKEVINRLLKKLDDANIMIKPQEVVSGLTFGFWVGLLWRHYENFWRTVLYHAFPHAPKPLMRTTISSKMFEIARLRNRIAHHEPIYNRHLPKLYDDIMSVVSWISPAAEKWLKAHSHFISAYEEFNDYKACLCPRKIYSAN